MSDGALVIAVLALTLLHGAWRELRDDNRRDAGLLAGVGIAGLLGAAFAAFG